MLYEAVTLVCLEMLVSYSSLMEFVKVSNLFKTIIQTRLVLFATLGEAGEMACQPIIEH